MKSFPLSQAKKNKNIRITGLPSDSFISARLVSLGILMGDELKFVGKSIAGSPLAFMKKGGVFFALRKDEASFIFVEEV